MIIGGYEKLSLCDYPGTPAIVIFLQGCNFNCPFCHNRALLPFREGETPVKMKDILHYLRQRRNVVPAVVISGGEPTLQPDLDKFIQAIKKIGYKVKIDTNGSMPDCIASLLSRNLIDYIAMDVKGPWQKYDLLSGCEVDREAIQKSIRCIAESKIPHHFRTTHYPPMLTEEDLADIKSFLPGNSLHIVQPFKDNAIPAVH